MKKLNQQKRLLVRLEFDFEKLSIKIKYDGICTEVNINCRQTKRLSTNLCLEESSNHQFTTYKCTEHEHHINKH